jgi:fructose-bisphosphate aldolase, class II
VRVGKDRQSDALAQQGARDDFRRAMLASVTIIHINTEIRFAWRRGLEDALAESPDEVVPYRIYGRALKEMQIVAGDRLRLFSGR